MFGWIKRPAKQVAAFVDSGADEAKLKRAALKAVFYTCFGAIVFAYALDMIFFGSHAGVWYLVPLFILIGWVFRTATVFLPVFLSNMKGTGNNLARGSLRTLWVLCLIACWFPAISFFAAGHDLKASDGETAVAVTGSTVESKQARIEVLENRISAWRQDRDDLVDDLKETRETIQDQVSGTSREDNITLREIDTKITEAQDDFSSKEAAANAQIDAILAEKEIVVSEQAAAEQIATTWAVFDWLGRWTPVSTHYWSNWGMFYFAMLGELIAGLGWALYCQIAQPVRRSLDRSQVDDRLTEIEHDRQIREAQYAADLALQKSEDEHRRRKQQAADEAKIQEQELEIERLTRLAKSEERIIEKRKELAKIQEAMREHDEGTADENDPNARAGNGGRARALYERARKNQRIEIDDISLANGAA